MVIRAPDQRSAQGAYERLDDRMLVLDFQAGHPGAFVEIHNRYGPLARRVCLRFLRNPQDADEALQETMIRVFQGLNRFNGRYALSPWVARIAKNVSLDIIRSRGRRPQKEHEGTDAPELEDKGGETPEAAYERLVERDLVLSVLADMPVPHRDALVLRELEGRSHRDIAHELDISTSQAKALIHRAKASFRRRWLVAVTEKGRLSAIAVLPLLWAAKVLDVGKRVVDRVGHATHILQAASPEVVAAASASSAAPVAAVGISERVVAAGMTILLAGGVTVGAAKYVEHRSDSNRNAAVAAAPVIGDAVTDTGTSATEDPEGDAKAEPIVDEPAPPEGPLPVVLPPSTDTPSPSDVPSPSEPPPSDEPSPSVDPSPSEEPPVLPPAWSGSFAIAWPSEDKCGCGPALELVSSSSNGDLLGPEAHMVVAQSLRGALLDGEGDAAWALTADLTFDLRRDGGALDGFTFWLTTRSGVTITFGAHVIATTVVGDLDAGEPVLYTFRGEYAAAGTELDLSPIRTAGPFEARLSVWSDGQTVVLTEISLLP